MDLLGAHATFKGHVVPRLLAPSAELLLDALPEGAPGQRVLEVSAGLGTLTGALAVRLGCAEGRADLVVVAREDLMALPQVPPSVHFVRGNAERLPFQDRSFDVVVGNLTLGARAYDAARAAAMRRSLKPGGAVVLTTLLAGSFDEVFDVLTEVSEHEPDPKLRAAVTDARRELYEESELFGLLEEQGFAIEDSGEEERALWYDSGTEAAQDPLFFEALAATWLGGPPGKAVRDHAARFLDTYFERRRFAVRVRTSVVRGRAPA